MTFWLLFKHVLFTGQCVGEGSWCGIMSLTIKVSPGKTPIKWTDLNPFSFSNYWKLVYRSCLCTEGIEPLHLL